MQISRAGNSNSHPAKEGFTLFELLIVMVVLAVAGGLVVPQMGLLSDKNNVQKSVRLVQGSIDQARTRALLLRQRVEVAFSEDFIRVQGMGGKVELPSDSKFLEIDFGDETQPSRKLPISSRGVAASSLIRISVAGKPYTLRVSPILRRLDVQKGFADFSEFEHR